MNTEDNRHLRNLFHTFGVIGLGEGDSVAGANLLASMACSLAAIQKPGSCIIDSRGSTIGVGTNLIVSCPLSAALVDEKILSGMGRRQGNLDDLLRRTHRRHGVTVDDCRLLPANGPDIGDSMRESFIDNPSSPGLMRGQDAERLLGLLLRDPCPATLHDLRERPAVFITGTTPAQIAKQLDRSHLGRPFAHARIDEVEGFARLGGTMAAVTGGRGTAVITDPDGLLGEALRTGLPGTNWISRAIWLGEGQSGFELPDNRGGETGVILDAIERRFNIAMDIAWGQRVGNRTPPVMQREFAEAQIRWMDFLRDVEPGFPGITGTARNLQATLLFGLQALIDAVKIPSGFRLAVEQVGALAEWVVRRMVQFRAEMLRLAENARRRRLETSIILKLGDGALCARDLVRKFHALPSEQCFEVLHDLRAKGQVHHSGGRWRLVKPPALADAEHLLLEA